MKRNFDALAGEIFDLIVVGGGIVGTGVARDAALRGLRTLLLEKEDFGYGTTSRSSRLIHGGLRYLRRMELGLVRQDLKEREVLLGIAPHLVHPLPFVIPIVGALRRTVLGCGLLLYDLLSFDKTLPSREWLSRRETLEREPGLELDGLVGSYLYYDCQVPHAERLCVENALSAVAHDALVFNHARVTGLLLAGNAVRGVELQDALSGEAYHARARLVVNAAGPWLDSVCDMLPGGPKLMVRRTKGVHLLTPQICRNAVVLLARKDGRLLFVIPWQGYSLIGTTDTDYTGNPDAVTAEAGDVAYLLEEVCRAFPALQKANIFYTTAGLRVLAGSGGRASDISRQHKLVDHETRDGVAGLVSILGGKLTGYRAIAEETVDLVCRKLDWKAPCRSAQLPLPGAPTVSAEELARESGLSTETAAHLGALYGSRCSQILKIVRGDPGEARPICPHSLDILAQIRHAVEEEGTLTIADFLLRRSTVGLNQCQGTDAAETVAQAMSRLLGWSVARQRREVQEYLALGALTQAFRTASANGSLPRGWPATV